MVMIRQGMHNLGISNANGSHGNNFEITEATDKECIQKAAIGFWLFTEHIRLVCSSLHFIIIFCSSF